MRKTIIAAIAALTMTSAWALPSLAHTGPTLEEGQARADAGDIRGALAIYQSLASTRPNSHEILARLGGMQLLDQRYAEAVTSFQRAIAQGDEGTRSFLGMGMAYLHMGQLGPARAAFTEARSRGATARNDIDRIIDWIDARQPVAQQRHP